MEVADATGKTILKGSHVRYTGTGSAGEVLEIKTDDDGTWAKVDNTDLWYNSEFLELMDEQEYQQNKRRTKQLKERVDKEAQVEKAVKLKKGLEDIDMSNELCDGGG